MYKNKGKLIVIEGADGSGKATQARLPAKALEEYGSVSSFEFPRYKKSTFGHLIGRCLAGEFGDFLQLSPYLSSLPYILDRARAKPLLDEALKEGNVVCDRYTPSNLVFQSAKLPRTARAAFAEFLEAGEYEELGLPMPDLVVYLSVPAHLSAELITQKQKRSYLNEQGVKDIHEKNLAYQKKVIDIYKEMTKKRNEWKMVECFERGKMLSREDVHHKVMKLVKQFLKIG